MPGRVGVPARRPERPGRGQRRQPHRGPAHQRVPVGHDRVQLLAPRRVHHQAGSRRLPPGHREVQEAVGHRRQPFGHRQVEQLDLEIRGALLQPAQRQLQTTGEPGRGADADPGRRRVHDRTHPLRRRQGLPGRGQHPVPGGGEPDVARGPVQQPGPELAFEPGHLLAHRGLHDVQPLGGPAEVQLLGHRHEVAQPAQFHPAPSPASVDHERRSLCGLFRSGSPGPARLHW